MGVTEERICRIHKEHVQINNQDPDIQVKMDERLAIPLGNEHRWSIIHEMM